MRRTRDVQGAEGIGVEAKWSFGEAATHGRDARATTGRTGSLSNQIIVNQRIEIFMSCRQRGFGAQPRRVNAGELAMNDGRRERWVRSGPDCCLRDRSGVVGSSEIGWDELFGGPPKRACGPHALPRSVPDGPVLADGHDCRGDSVRTVSEGGGRWAHAGFRAGCPKRPAGSRCHLGGLAGGKINFAKGP